MDADELAFLWFSVNGFGLIAAVLIFAFRYRPWPWVAILKIAGFPLLVVFQIAALSVWAFGRLPREDVIVYLLWSLAVGALASKFGREGIAHLLLIRWGRFGELTKLPQYTLVFSRNGSGEPTLRVTARRRTGAKQ